MYALIGAGLRRDKADFVLYVAQFMRFYKKSFVLYVAQFSVLPFSFFRKERRLYVELWTMYG